MNQSTNYNLKIYEGTDLFNPLTVENVNFNDLDSIVKDVSDAAIGRATELLTGTVHALTRVDPDRDYFAFTATANFTAGDTFTLDGAQVSALTPDGQQLATGAYIIGSEVLVLVKGTLLTFILNPAKAPDADKLDGHDSSYFAKDSDMTQAQNDITALSTKVGTAVLTTTAQDCSGAINELNSNFTALTKVQRSNQTLTTDASGEVRVSVDGVNISAERFVSAYIYTDAASLIVTSFTYSNAVYLIVKTKSGTLKPNESFGFTITYTV